MVVGVQTCALLHSICELKTIQMNMLQTTEKNPVLSNWIVSGVLRISPVRFISFMTLAKESGAVESCLKLPNIAKLLTYRSSNHSKPFFME